MKSKSFFFGLLVIALLGISTIFVCCNKDLYDTIYYSGKVVYLKTTTPFPNLAVKITDGNNIPSQGFTDEEGRFRLKVKVTEINGDYYLRAGDSTCVPKDVPLDRWGQEEVDLGTIEVEGPSAPVVKTHKVSSITAEGAICGGEVTSTGRLKVTARGVCYGKEGYPDLSGLHTKDGEGPGEFKSTLSNLEYNTIYYVRAYATNDMGTAYGEQIKFTTEEGVPVVVTDTITRITAHSARCTGHVESDGGFQVTKRGTCWSKKPDPTLDDEFTDDGSGLGEFTSALKDLQEDTKYYVRAYATNSTATVYGEQIIITTLDGLPIVITDSITTISATGFTAYGNVVSDCDLPVSARGFCYATAQYPTIEDEHTTVGKGLGAYQSNVRNLEIGTTYYVRAYATNATGTTYSEQVKVETADGLPVVKTTSVSSLATTSISASCEVAANGGFDVTERGVCYSTSNQAPTIENEKVVSGKGNGKYSVAINNLAVGTTYYIRAFATNANGTSYGDVLKIATKDGVAEVTLGAITEITALTASASVTITDAAGATLLSCGICWSTNPNPTISDNYCEARGKQLNAAYVCNLSELQPNTKYFVRAYATTDVTTTYSAQRTFTTADGLPVVSTTFIGENVTETTAVSGGQVTDDGGSPVISRGVCWSTVPYPTINDNKTTDGSGKGNYSSQISGIDLTGTKTYYVRAYATNQNGTAYGNELVINNQNLEYKNLPRLEVDGFVYVLYHDIGDMFYGEAVQVVDSMTFAGYDDWILEPSTERMRFIMTHCLEGWKTMWGDPVIVYTKENPAPTSDFKSAGYYWTSDPSCIDGYQSTVYCEPEEMYDWETHTEYYAHSAVPHCTQVSSNQARVRPMRRDRKF